MTVSGQTSQPTQMPFVLYIDTIGSLANDTGVHTLNCGEKLTWRTSSPLHPGQRQQSHVHSVGRARISQENFICALNVRGTMHNAHCAKAEVVNRVCTS